MADIGLAGAKAAGGAAARVLGVRRSPGPELSAIAFTDIPVIHPAVRRFHPFSEADCELLGFPAETLHVARVAFTNTGTEPLLASAFARPIEIVFVGDVAALVQVSVEWRRVNQLHPDDESPVDITSDVSESVVKLRPSVTNPGDGFILTAIIAQAGRVEVAITVRYPGISRVETLHFTAPSTNLEFENVDAAIRQTSWLQLRKFLPKRLNFRRSSQLRDLIAHLADWKE